MRPDTESGVLDCRSASLPAGQSSDTMYAHKHYCVVLMNARPGILNIECKAIRIRQRVGPPSKLIFVTLSLLPSKGVTCNTMEPAFVVFQVASVVQ